MNTELNFQRLGFYLRRQLYLNLSTLWVSIVAVVGLLLVISAIVTLSDPSNVMNLRNLYLVVLMLGGYIFTSKVFDEMHAPQKSYMFLTLPVSAAEKLAGAWLISSPLYLVVASLFMLLLSFLSLWMAGNLAALPAFFDQGFWNCIEVYLVTQAVFLLGATAFRSNNFLKTLLAVIVVVLVLAAYTGGLGYLLIGHGNHHFDEQSQMGETGKYIFTKVIPALFWWVFAPFLLLVSYFKLKERQV